MFVLSILILINKGISLKSTLYQKQKYIVDKIKQQTSTLMCFLVFKWHKISQKCMYVK